MSGLTLYSRSDFHNDLDTDLWVLEKFDWLPENPPPIIDEKEGEVRIQLFDDFSLEAKQEAIKRYRKHLTPVIFTLTQKIYAELFRLVLGQSNCPSIKKDVPRQVDVEEIIEIILGQRVNPPSSKQISKLSSSFPSSLKFQPVFDNKAEFINWGKVAIIILN